MKNSKIPDWLIIIGVLVLIFQSPLSMTLPGAFGKLISYADETIAIALFLYGIVKRKFSKTQKRILFTILALILIGTAGTLIHNFQPIKAVLEDIVNSSKFLFSVFGALAICSRKDNSALLVRMQKIASVIILIFLLLTIVGYLVNLPFLNFGDVRFGIKSLALIYYHPALLSQILVFLLAILSIKNDKNSHKKEKLACLAMLCLTLRTKSIGFAIAYLIIDNYKFINKTVMRKLVVFTIAASSIFFLAKDSVSTYYSSMEDTARGRLTLSSIDIAKEAFPFGYGYAAYGSASAAKFYSPVYRNLGFNQIYGLGYANTNYATDTFWPAILGEFGVLGLIIFVSFIAYLLKTTLKTLKANQSTAYLLASLLVFMLLISTSSSSFFNPISVLYGIFMGLPISEINGNKRGEK